MWQPCSECQEHMKKKAGAKTTAVNTATSYELLGGRNGKAH